MTLLKSFCSDDALDGAYDWLCQRKKDYPDSSDIWDFRRDWLQNKQEIKAELQEQTFRFHVLSKVLLANGEFIDLWSARDALVLKALTGVLSPILPVSPKCVHVEGHGGAKNAVCQVADALAGNPFVFRTDVKSYYASIDHLILMEKLAKVIPDRFILNLLGQYLMRVTEYGGIFEEHDRGISLGCSLSPLIGAFFLTSLDDLFQDDKIFYIRFMDDILILAPTRWKLRHAIRKLNQEFAVLDLQQHPDKTFIGRVAQGFEFLGYRFDLNGIIGIAKKTLEKFSEHIGRLYEQNRTITGPVELYVRRWLGWALAGLHCGCQMQWISGFVGRFGRSPYAGQRFSIQAVLSTFTIFCYPCQPARV